MKPAPETQALIEKLMQDVNESNLQWFQVMEALGLVAQGIAAGDESRIKENAGYVKSLVFHLMGSMDEFHKDIPQMPVGVNLVALAHLYYTIAKGLQTLKGGNDGG